MTAKDLLIIKIRKLCESEILEPHGNVEHKIVTMIRNWMKDTNNDD